MAAGGPRTAILSSIAAVTATSQVRPREGSGSPPATRPGRDRPADVRMAVLAPHVAVPAPQPPRVPPLGVWRRRSRTTNPGSKRARRGRGPQWAGRGSAARCGARSRLRHGQSRAAASCRCLRETRVSIPRFTASPARLPRGRSGRAPSRGLAHAGTRATGRSAGAGDEREEPA